MNVTTRYGITAGPIAAVAFTLFLAGCATTPAPSAAARAELAGTGKVRVALINVGNYITQPQATPPTGLGVDMGKSLADRVGVPFEPVVYATVTALLSDARSGKWDVAILGYDPARAADFEFTRPYAFTENSYLVPAGSGLMTIADVDRKGVKVNVAARTAQFNYLKANLKQAEVNATPTNAQGAEELTAGKAQAFAANRTTLEELAAKMPGYRVVPGSFFELRYVLGVPKGRMAAAAYVDEFVRDYLASGAMAETITRANLKGVKPATQ
jgi:polar amino acid transport system substrate-binding protein